MARCSSEERIFIVEQMTSTNSRKETWRRFKAKFGREVNLLTISATMKKWKAVGSIQNQHKGNSGRKKSARSQENQDKISRSSCKTIRSLSEGLHLLLTWRNRRFTIFFGRTSTWNPTSPRRVKIWRKEFMAAISVDLLQRVTNQFTSRVRRCIAARGGLFE